MYCNLYCEGAGITTRLAFSLVLQKFGQSFESSSLHVRRPEYRLSSGDPALPAWSIGPHLLPSFSSGPSALQSLAQRRVRRKAEYQHYVTGRKTCVWTGDERLTTPHCTAISRAEDQPGVRLIFSLTQWQRISVAWIGKCTAISSAEDEVSELMACTDRCRLTLHCNL